jgi:hypothetical protein
VLDAAILRGLLVAALMAVFKTWNWRLLAQARWADAASMHRAIRRVLTAPPPRRMLP